jgi:hypothetical protein
MYSVTSVIDALRSNSNLILEDIEIIGCPSQRITDCIPNNCEKGKHQSCKQPITIYNEYQKLIVLTFRFFVSENNHAGFVRKDDSSLQRLINHNFVNKSLLQLIKGGLL